MQLSTNNSNSSLMKLISGQQTKQTENAQYRKYKASTIDNKYNCYAFDDPSLPTLPNLLALE